MKKYGFNLLKVAFYALPLLFFACAPSDTDSTATDATQEETVKAEDKTNRPSPPAKLETKFGMVEVVVDYSQPAVKGRKIWGEIVNYGDVWRTGANEATTISFSKDVLIEGKPLAAGKYALFSIPEEGEWTIIFNKKAEQWGAFEYSESEDALRVKVSPMSGSPFAERFTFSLEDGKINFAWDTLKVGFKVEEAK